MQWHGMIYVLYTQGIATFLFNRYSNSMRFLKDVLIPEIKAESPFTNPCAVDVVMVATLDVIDALEITAEVPDPVPQRI